MPSKDFPRLSATSQRTRPRRVCKTWSRSRRRRCALGRRVTTTTQEGTVRHVYDNNWQCIADVDASGNVLRSYVWGDGIDNLLAVKIGDDVYTALTDNQGTVWGLTDGSGEVVARWTYDAWGNVLSSDVTVPALAALRYRFQGREWSAVTGLMNFRMRWYDAVTGRWLSKDPIGLNGGVNLYAFCENIPLGCLDPFGLARFGIRGLNARGIGVQTTFALGITTVFAPITMPAVGMNLGLFHEHIFFDDDKLPSDQGYSDKGVGPDSIDESEYHMFGPKYDDKIMRKAIKNLVESGEWKAQGQENGYNVIRHNCQDFAEAARQEYERLGGRTRK